MDSFSDCLNAQHTTVAKKRRKGSVDNRDQGATYTDPNQAKIEQQVEQWKRIMLLVIAITVHNIPEGKKFLGSFFKSSIKTCLVYKYRIGSRCQLWCHWKNTNCNI